MFTIDTEHPPMHIHIKYGEYEAVMEIENLNLIEGNLPKRARILVREWAEMHQAEIKEIWETQNFHKNISWSINFPGINVWYFGKFGCKSHSIHDFGHL